MKVQINQYQSIQITHIITEHMLNFQLIIQI